MSTSFRSSRRRLDAEVAEHAAGSFLGADSEFRRHSPRIHWRSQLHVRIVEKDVHVSPVPVPRRGVADPACTGGFAAPVPCPHFSAQARISRGV